MDFLQAFRDYLGPKRYQLYPYILPQKSRFALICPGGGYNMVCSFAEGKPHAKKLNKMGYSAFVLRYDTREKGCYPTPMADVARALRYILDNSEMLNVEPEGFSIWGSSAGGHLAASFGTENMGYPHYGLPKPSALILSYPVITMGKFGHPGSRDSLLGLSPPQLLIDETSVEQHVWPGFPPTFVWCGKDDEVVDYRNSTMLARQMELMGIPHKLTVFEHVRHGLGLAEKTDAKGWFSEAVEFWETYV